MRTHEGPDKIWVAIDETWKEANVTFASEELEWREIFKSYLILIRRILWNNE